MNTNDTICAIATATGGALGIIRVSGNYAIEAAAKIFTPRGKKPFNKIQHNTAVFGEIKNDDGSTLDEVIAVSYKAPHSYTGENSVEFSCHGSSFILNHVIQLLLSNGCRMAKPGEFTERAFLNGKMDLSQAEAVADLIASRSEISHKAAMSQLKGGFKERISRLREKLKGIQSLLELELDFSDHEDLDFVDHKELTAKAEEIQTEIQSLMSSFYVMNAIKNGVPVAIIGNTNVGKSTLMNALLSDSRAIVSNIPGTTRDTIEENIIIKNIEFRFIDTAGIRKTNDEVENLGIKKTFETIDNASIVVWVVSAPEVQESKSEYYAGKIREILAKNKALITVINKADAMSDSHSLQEAKAEIEAYLHAIIKPQENYTFNHISEKEPIVITTSAKNKQGIEALDNALVSIINKTERNSSDSLIVNERHYEALSNANKNILNVIKGLQNNLPADLISQDLRELLMHLSTISGEITSEEILNTIFSNFCIGK